MMLPMSALHSELVPSWELFVGYPVIGSSSFSIMITTAPRADGSRFVLKTIIAASPDMPFCQTLLHCSLLGNAHNGGMLSHHVDFHNWDDGVRHVGAGAGLRFNCQ